MGKCLTSHVRTQYILPVPAGPEVSPGDCPLVLPQYSRIRGYLTSVALEPFPSQGGSLSGALKEIKRIYAPGILDCALEILKPVKAKISIAVVEGSAKQAMLKERRQVLI